MAEQPRFSEKQPLQELFIEAVNFKVFQIRDEDRTHKKSIMWVACGTFNMISFVFLAMHSQWLRKQVYGFKNFSNQ